LSWAARPFFVAVPSTTDLTTYLTSIGVTAPAAVDEQGILNAVTAELEQRTGRTKFEGDSQLTEVRYTLPWPQGESVILEIRDVWELSEVRTGWTGAVDSGTLLTEYTDFEVLPMQYELRNLPIEAIKFRYCPTTEPGAIMVKGKLGVQQTMPRDVFNAILAKAAAQVLTQIAGAEGSITDQKQGDRQVKFGTSDGQSTIQRLQREFDLCVSRWVKVMRI
jgi:hypothetical protein